MRIPGPLYWHPKTYRFLLNFIERGTSEERYRKIAEEVGESSVLDLCCGDCHLTRFLAHDRYRGLDVNAGFVRAARRRGLDVQQANLAEDPLPNAECITILHSLYQFQPRVEALLEKAMNAASGTVIVCEATSGANLAGNPWVRRAMRMILQPGVPYSEKGLGLAELQRLAGQFDALRTVEGPNYFLAVFRGRGPR